jgi:hypothetical protein
MKDSMIPHRILENNILSAKIRRKGIEAGEQVGRQSDPLRLALQRMGHHTARNVRLIQ